MLVLTRKSEEGINIFPDTITNSSMTVEELFAEGPIRVIVRLTEKNNIKVGIEAPRGLKILREELKELDD
jgi:sRNA-binding carbon storage regulator CsrA